MAVLARAKKYVDAEEPRTSLKVFGALSGDLSCEVLVDRTWSVRRLKTEIANTEGTATEDQHLLAGINVLQDDQVVGDVLKELAGVSEQIVTLVRNGSAPLPVDHLHVSYIHWQADIRKLQGSDRQLVSRPYELNFGGRFHRVVFRALITPGREGSFRKANGKCRIKLKCDSQLPKHLSNIRFRVCLGNGQDVRGPFSHDFSRAATCQVANDEDLYDLKWLIGSDDRTLDLRFEITHNGSDE